MVAITSVLAGLVAVMIVSACSATVSRTTVPPSSSEGAGSVAPSHVGSVTRIAAASVSPRAAASASPTMPVEAPIKPEAIIAAPDIGQLASDGTVLWALTGSGAIARLDPATNVLRPLATVDPAHMDGRLAANARGVWLNDFDADLVYRFDPVSLKIVKISVLHNPEGLAVDPRNGAVWVASHRGGTVVRIDPATNRVVATIAAGNVGPSGPHQIGLGLGSVWVGVPNSSSVYRIDPATNSIMATIAIPSNASPCSGFAFSQQAVWMPSCGDATTLVRIDPATNTVVGTIDLGGNGEDPITVNGIPWLTVESVSLGPTRLVRIDPGTNTIDRVVSLGDHFRGSNMVVAAGSVWVIDYSVGDIVRLPLAAFSH
jgi:virginiamycin B lyase